MGAPSSVTEPRKGVSELGDFVALGIYVSENGTESHTQSGQEKKRRRVTSARRGEEVLCG